MDKIGMSAEGGVEGGRALTEVVPDTTCGFWGVRPRFLQRFATPKGFMLVYGFLGTVQAMAFIYFIVSLTTMERRFKIPSKTTGVMLSGNELSQILLALFLSYFGGQRNRPKWIAWGVTISALSCFILALPHFIYGPGEEALGLTKEYSDMGNVTTILGHNVTSKIAAICSADQPQHNCDNDVLGENSMLPIILVFLSQFILGIGNTLYYSLGNTYLDDNTKKVKTPMLLGYSSALRTLGPAVGFILGPICLSIFIDPSLTPLVTKDDPRWYGAWWLGWIIIGFLMLIFAGLVGLFPKHLPKKSVPGDTSLPQYPKIPPLPSAFADEAPLNKDIVEEKDIADDKPTMKDLPVALKRLLNNRILVSNILSGVFYILGSSAYITYMAKYSEVQYSTSAAKSTSILGPAVLIGMVGGFLLSGWIISTKKPHPKILLFWNVIMGSVYILGELSYIFLSCPVPDIEAQLINGSAVLALECNSACSCDAVTYEPVCHRPTGQIYFSACHAGCTERFNGSQVFTNCSCLPSANSSWIEESPTEAWDMMHAGACARDCQMTFLMFIVVSSVVNILGSSGRIGNILVNYRCVEERDKSFAQGLLLLLVSLCALIPGPIIYGAIIDATCIEWKDSCGGRGNCALYDRDKFRLWVNSTAIGFTFIGVVLDVFVWYWGQNLDLYGDKEEAEAKQPDKNRDSAYS